MTRILENVFAIIACFFCFVSILLLLSKSSTDCLENTGKEAVAELLSEVAAGGEITRTAYEICVNALYMSGYDGECRITVFTEEYAVDGENRSYTVTWEEIEREVFEKGVYKCPEKSFVRVTIERNKESKSWIRSMAGDSGKWSACIYVREGAGGV